MIFFSKCSSFSESIMDSTLKLMGFKVHKQGRRLIVHGFFQISKEAFTELIQVSFQEAVLIHGKKHLPQPGRCFSCSLRWTIRSKRDVFVFFRIQVVYRSVRNTFNHCFQSALNCFHELTFLFLTKALRLSFHFE